MSAATDRLASSTHQHYVLGWTDIIREANVLLYKIAEEGGVKTGVGGTTIDWKVRDAKDSTTVGSWSGMDQIPFVPVDRYSNASLPWRGYAGSYTVSQTDLWENSGENAIFNLMEAEEQNLLYDLQEHLEDELFASNGTTAGTYDKSIMGIPAFIDVADSTPDQTYASIVQNTNAQWDNQYKASSGAGNIVKDTVQFATDCCRGPDKRRGKPNLIATTRTMWAVYNFYLVNSVRYRDEKLANAGFENVMVCNIPMVWSDSCTANHLFYLNTRYLRLVQCNKGPLFVPMSEMRMSPVAKIFAYISHFNLVCLSPRQQGDLDATSNTYA